MQRGTPWAKALFAASVAGALSAAMASAMGYPVSAWWLVGCAVGLLIAVGAGVFLMSSGLFARPILGVEPGRCAGRLALTFDDGPDEQHTRAVMDSLEARGHQGTFFVIGKRAEEHPALVEEIVRRGHGLGNHTYAHSWMTPAMAVGRLVEDLERAGAVLARATAPHGRPAPRWFRPPVGILSPRVALAAKAARLELVGWTATARDGVRADVEKATARLVRAARPGAILVLHDAAERGTRAPIAVAVLARLLDTLDARGLKSVTLDELLG